MSHIFNEPLDLSNYQIPTALAQARLEQIPLVPHQKFQKIPRFNREIIITEKIDGTNGVVYISQPYDEIVDPGTSYAPGIGTRHYSSKVYAGSRKRWLTVEKDNFGFAAWVQEHASDLRKLGPGFHYGEWYGQGIQRNYGLDHKRFALFNVSEWADPNWRPACCDVVTVLARAEVPGTIEIENALLKLRQDGSATVPGFMNPEGIVIFHTASGHLYKITLEHDEQWKGQSE